MFVFLLVILTILFLILGFSYYAYRIAFHAPKRGTVNSVSIEAAKTFAQAADVLPPGMSYENM